MSLFSYSIRVSVFLFVLLATGACTSSPDTRCEMGVPQAIFQPSLPAVTSHRFDQQGQRSVEDLTLQDGLEISVEQSGCERVRQVFTFELPTGHPLVDDETVAAVEGAFYQLGGLDPSLAQFQAFGAAIRERAAEILPGRPVTLVPGMSIQVDALDAGDRPVLRVIFQQVEQ